MEFPNGLYFNKAALNSGSPPDTTFLAEEIEKLTQENYQLREDNRAKDFDYVTVIEQLDGKENEIEDLRTELDQLSEQITRSRAKEEEYLNSARSCLSLENHIRDLQRKLDDHKREFEELSRAHAECPTPEELESAVERAKESFRTQISEAGDRLGERDQRIMALEDRIARKDVELQKLSSELMQSRTECHVTHQRCGHLERAVAGMEDRIQDRERLIGNMKILMTRKSVKINLLLLRIRELEIKLEMCVQQLRGAKTSKSAPAGCLQNDENGVQNLRKALSQKAVRGLSQGGSNRDLGREGDVEYDDATGFWEELSSIQNRVVNAPGASVSEIDILLDKINKVKTKVQRKLEKEASANTEVTRLIYSARRHFDQTQTEIERMRAQENRNGSRDLIRGLVAREMRLNKILESLEIEKMAVNARSQSFSKAWRNLETLEELLKKSKIDGVA